MLYTFGALLHENTYLYVIFHIGSLIFRQCTVINGKEKKIIVTQIENLMLSMQRWAEINIIDYYIIKVKCKLLSLFVSFEISIRHKYVMCF